MTVKKYLFSAFLMIGIFGFATAQETTYSANPFKHSIMEKLDLTEEQKVELSAIKEKYSKQMVALRKRGQDERTETTTDEWQTLLDNQAKEIRAVLNKVQVRAYDDMIKNRTNKLSPELMQKNGGIID